MNKKNLSKKNTIMVALFVILCIMMTNVAVAADLPPVRVTASVDKVEAIVRDTVRLTLTVDHDPGIEVDVPLIDNDIADLKLLKSERNPPKEIDGRIVIKSWYDFKADNPGAYSIPPIEVYYADENAVQQVAKSSEIYFSVKTTLSTAGEHGEPAQDIIDIKGLAEVKVDYTRQIIIYGSIGVLLLLLLILAIRLIKKRNHVEVVIPILPPHEIAFKELEELKDSSLVADKRVKEYYFELSAIARRYLEGRFGFNAYESTTEEILPILKNALLLDDVLKSLIRKFLLNTDVVKFTEYTPGENEIQLELSRAYKIVEQTMLKEEPVEGEESDTTNDAVTDNENSETVEREVDDV